MPASAKKKTDKENASTSEATPFARIELTTNTIKPPQGTSEKEKKVAVLDIEGLIGYWDWDKYIDDIPQNTSEDIGKVLAELEKDMPDELKINIINSPGGLIGEGIAMHDKISLFKTDVTTDIIGFAASMAIPLAQAGNTRRISSNAQILVHKPMAWPDPYSNVNDLREVIDSLEMDARILNGIMTRRGVNAVKLAELMEEDGGHGKWISAQEALEYGFVDEVYEPFSAVACTPFKGVNVKSMCAAFNIPEITPPQGRREPDNINNVNDNSTEENDMDEEQLLAALAKNNEALVASLAAALKPQEQMPEVPEESTNSQEPKFEKPAYEGDLTDADAIAQYEQDCKIAEIEFGVDRTNLNEILKAQEAINKIRNGGTNKVAPSSNSSTPAPIVDGENNANADDTIAFMRSKCKKTAVK
jgi:ATP-dependent protease ClpP protease subunit